MIRPAWDRVKQLFEQTLDHPPADRQDFLAAACGDDVGLQAEVEALVRAHEAAGEFLETPVAAQVGCAPPRDSDTVVGRLVGPYRIVAEVGRGGMGVVYKARREGDEYTQEVAVKLVPAGQSSSRLAVRFRQERRILAQLEHPHIARLIDGATTDDGRLYYAMEFVDGRPLDVYCVEANLGPRARLELFRTICAAVSYAHRNLVVHRDLKPGNILVTADGSPKLLDFGIAKLLSADDAGNAEHTAAGLQLMTPEYASPEQVRGDPVTTATDVYSLGVILYILLTDRRPYEFSTRSADEMVRIVCHEDPRPPSTMVAAARRLLSGDLDTIVLKALRKEPERRYTSVDDLSDDIRRYLAGMTVGARPDTLRYRTAKFVTRHRGAVAGLAVALLSLLAGLAATTYQMRIAETNRQRAERRFQDVRRIANSLVFELHDSIADLPGATAARALVLRRASELLDTLVVDAPADPVLGEEVAAAYHRLGGVLGSAGESSLGDGRAAEQAHRKGLAIRTQLAAASPTDLDRQDGMASSHVDLSYAIQDGREALAHAREAARIGEQVAAAQPGNARYQRHLANACFAEGSQLVEVGDLAGAIQAFNRAGVVYEGLLRRTPDDATLLRNATLVHKRLGAILTKLRQFPAALEHYREAVSADETRVAKDPTSVTARYDLSVSLVDLGVTFGAAGDWASQVSQCERALGLREELSQSDPSNALARAGMVSVLGRLAGALRALGHHERALAYLRRALSIPGVNAEDPVSLAGVHFAMASVYVDLTRWEEATRAATISVRAWQTLADLKPANPWYRTGLARAHEQLGAAMVGLAARPGRPADEAAADRRRAAASYRVALSLALALEAEGLLVGNDATLPERARQGLARSDRARGVSPGA